MCESGEIAFTQTAEWRAGRVINGLITSTTLIPLNAEIRTKKKNHYLLQTGLFCDVACDKEIHISETRGGRKERKNGRRDERQSDILSKTVMTTFQVTLLFILQIAPFLRCFETRSLKPDTTMKRNSVSGRVLCYILPLQQTTSRGSFNKKSEDV